MTPQKLLASLCLAFLTATTALAQKGIRLIQGSDLSGWVQRGGKATFKVEGSEIVGSAMMNTPNTFLCTEKTYGDFVLEFEFKVDPRLNSGVQVRSERFEQTTQVDWKGRKISIPAGRVHGYQIEIDPDPKRDRWWTAGIYDEGRRDWLFPGVLGGDGKAFTENGRKLFKQGDWNHVRVEAIGSSMKTWLNGKACAQIEDLMTPRGFIALQVHNIGDASLVGAEVRWRNLILTDLTPPANELTAQEKASGWKLLWDGKSSAGWRSAKTDAFPSAGWVIQDGELSVVPSGGGESSGGGDIVTRERFSEFELTVDFRITPGANSGIKYFCQPNLDPITGTGAKSNTGSAIGLEFQILDDERHPDAKQGRDGNRTVGSLYDLIAASPEKSPKAIGEWNTARVLSRGGHVEHWLNGKLVLKYDRASEDFRRLVAISKYKSIPGFGEWRDGHILLQDHGDRVSFRNVKIKTLTGTG